ncbi:hypothetical protein LUX29_20590 [Aureimonas altamirensis]|uniref:hypothetical protein n=1 Tax=Aureimonas altamirensis TaxID=370622 RepID=UPI001E5E1DCA|nr:hypothetical protein [Aureimonas altamirensis]UHD45361.1 hypothetical protein LUX29_20590 [Aureimonas altamirensis]
MSDGVEGYESSVIGLDRKPYKREPGGTLPTGGGGDKYDEMEARVKALEETMKEVRADVKAVRLDVAEMKGRLNAMPTTWQMTGLIIGIMALSFAIIRFGLA